MELQEGMSCSRSVNNGLADQKELEAARVRMNHGGCSNLSGEIVGTVSEASGQDQRTSSSPAECC